MSTRGDGVSRTANQPDADADATGPIIRPLLKSVTLTGRSKWVRPIVWSVVVGLIFAAGWYWRGSGKSGEETAAKPPNGSVLGSLFGQNGSAVAKPPEEKKGFNRPEIVAGETKGREQELRVLHHQEIPDGAKDPTVKGDKIVIFVPQEFMVGEAIDPRIEPHPETGQLVLTYYQIHRVHAKDGSIQEIPSPESGLEKDGKGASNGKETVAVGKPPEAPPSEQKAAPLSPKPNEVAKDEPKAKAGAPSKDVGQPRLMPTTKPQPGSGGPVLGSPSR